MSRAKVFSETYAGYLADIRKIDWLARADRLGLKRVDNTLLVPLFDLVYIFDGEDFIPPPGEQLTPAVQVMLCKYLLTCSDFSGESGLEQPRWMTYREFKGSSPLHSYFTNNTNKTLESSFGGNINALKERGLALGGEFAEMDGYDLSLKFHAFPRVPMILNFNDRDEMFPAAASVLYKSTASNYLDLECLAMTGTLLTGKLLGKVKAEL